jgi:predicted transcriptional regulator
VKTKPKKFSSRLTVSLTAVDYERLSSVATQQDASVSWVIRRAIEDYLSHSQAAFELVESRKEPARNNHVP